jgi:hypothetical protein
MLLEFQRRTLPIRPKVVEAIRVNKILELAPEHLRTRAEAYLRYVTDVSAYPLIPPTPKLQTTALSRDDLRMLADRYSILKRPPKASTFGFKVAEIEKERCRPVWACAINDAEFPEKPPEITLHPYAKIMQSMNRADYFCQVDGKSMFDQFFIDNEDIRSYFSFLVGDSVVALNRIPMGFKYAPGVAQITSEVMSYDPPNEEEPMHCECIVHLDNLGFVWWRKGQENHDEEKRQIVRKMERFFKRAVEANFQLNEFTMEEMRKMNASNIWEGLQNHLIERGKPANQPFTFLGVTYDLQQVSTKRVAEKTKKKLTAVAAIIARQQISPVASYRQIAMLVGLIRYASKIHEFHNEDFTTYATLQKMSAECQKDESWWDRTIGHIHAHNLTPLVEIAERIMQSSPVPIEREWNCEKAIRLFVDASKVGWGAVALHPNGRSEVVKGRWTQPSLFESSVRAEPKGVEETIAALKLAPETTVLIITDHEGLVWASQAVQAHTYYYHKALRLIQTMGLNAKFLFIQGVSNPADEPSRDRPMTTPPQRLIELGAAAGAGAAWALQFPNSGRIATMRVMTGD